MGTKNFRKWSKSMFHNESWSTLRKSLLNLADPKLKIDIKIGSHTSSKKCRAKYYGEISYVIFLDKNPIWSFPKDFSNDVNISTLNIYTFSVKEKIRGYINTPRNELLEAEFNDNEIGLTDILKAMDRRISLDKLEMYMSIRFLVFSYGTSAAMKIIRKRQELRK